MRETGLCLWDTSEQAGGVCGRRIQRTSLPEPGCAGGTILHPLLPVS